MVKRLSQEIGATHERSVQQLLDKWEVQYFRKYKIPTKFGSIVELDFIIPETTNRPAVVLECKDFAVEAKHPSDSRRRKTQEALWLLIQVRRYCQETKAARIILIVGKTGFRPDQEALLKTELGEDFHIVPLSNVALLAQLIT